MIRYISPERPEAGGRVSLLVPHEKKRRITIRAGRMVFMNGI